MDVVLDASVAMRWLLPSESENDQKYAHAVLNALVDKQVVVPHLWHLEVASVLLAAEKRGDISVAISESFISQLHKLPVSIDGCTANQACARTLTLARNYSLSTYDAAYLELAIREGLPLSTLDKALRKACRKVGVALFMEA
jgi:predicted nucleic acid-binding protein